MVKTLSPTKHETTILPDIRPKGNMPATTVVLAFMGLLDRLDEKKKVVTDEIKKANQQAINAGLVIKELTRARQLRAMDPQAVVDEYARLKHYAQAAEVPIGSQLSLFIIPSGGGAEAPSQEALIQLAKSQGKVLGMLGKNPDYQKYHQNSDLGMAHTEGWHEGQHEVGLVFIESNERMNKAEAEKGKTKEQKAADKKEAAEKIAAEKKEKAEKTQADKREKAAAKASAKEIADAEKKAAKEAKAQQAAAKVVPIGRKKRSSGARKH